MFISTQIISTRMVLEAGTLAEERNFSSEHFISFELSPTQGLHHLDLDTGEIFQYYYFQAARHNEKAIGAGITVRAAPDEAHCQRSVMRYVEGYKDEELGDTPSSIHFDALISPMLFKELVENIRRSLFPSKITIELFHELFNKDSPIGYGWEPDGSGKIWHNSEPKNQVIPIVKLRFEYAVTKPHDEEHDEERVDQPLPPQSAPLADVITERFDFLQGKITDALVYLRWTATTVFVIAAMIAIVIFRQSRLF